MIEFDAVYYDGRTSARKLVRVGGYARVIHIVGEDLRLEVPLAKVQVDSPVARTRRSLRLPDGAQLQTDDHAAVDAVFPRAHTLERWVHTLERRWPYALAAFALTALFAWWAVVDGLPRAAKIAAEFVPVAAEEKLGEQTLELVDGRMCKPSALAPPRREALQRRFAKLTAGLADGYAYHLLPRACEIGPNAFALPGGSVVITDALVKLAKSDDQISAVLAHEIGHVRGRHGLRMALQAAGLAALAAALFGDTSSVIGLATSLPVALLQRGYSRDLETEADDYAFQRLKEVGVPRKAFAEIIALLQKGHGKRTGGKPGVTTESDYLSTHPATAKRIERALAAP